MKQLMTIAAGLTLTATALLAQTGGAAGGGGRGINGFQQFGIIGPADGQPVVMRIAESSSGPLSVTGSPLSATEERRTVQTLGDGTMLERSDSNLFYRDSQGRKRLEQTWQGKT